jgi:hypothetical protein
MPVLPPMAEAIGRVTPAGPQPEPDWTAGGTAGWIAAGLGGMLQV